MIGGQHLFVELFPIELLPRLHAYRVLGQRGELPVLGNLLADCLPGVFPGHWVWTGGRLVTDTPPNPVKLLMAVDTIMGERGDLAEKFGGLEEDYQWQPRPEVAANFVLRGPLGKLQDRLRVALGRTGFRLRDAFVEREPRITAWAVGDRPSLCFSIQSNLFHDPTLYNYAAALTDRESLVGLFVADYAYSMQGQITAVLGSLAEHRERLLSLSEREKTRELLENAPKDDFVVTVTSRHSQYHYAASTLNVLVGVDDLRRYESLPEGQALSLKPPLRAQMVKMVTDIVKAEKIITNAFSTQNVPELFIAEPPQIQIIFSKNRARPYDLGRLPQDFNSYGAYWWRERFQNEPVRAALIKAFDEPVDDFLEAMQRAIKRDFGFQFEVVRERKVRVVTHANLESAVRFLQKESFDVLLAFCEDVHDDDDDRENDSFMKAQTVGRGIPCLIIDKTTLHNPDLMPNVVMGMMARAGNVPYLLNDPLEYADYVVGLDLIREQKKDTEVMTGVMRLFRNDGALLCYTIASAPIKPGEGIPVTVLEQLFPAELFAGRQAIIHHQSVLRREALRALQSHEKTIGAVFHPVEVMGRDVPRIYALAQGKIEQPLWGTGFRLGEHDALLLTSMLPAAVAQPLHVVSESPALTLEQAVNSVLMFTTLHYGTQRQPRWPVTLHNAEFIRTSIARGMLPDHLQGDLPFWL